MSNQILAKQIARENGAKCIQKKPDWNGQEVWQMLFQMPGEPWECIGIPQFILFSENPHVMSDNEAMDYMDYLREQFPVDENADEDEDEDEDAEPVIIV